MNMMQLMKSHMTREGHNVRVNTLPAGVHTSSPLGFVSLTAADFTRPPPDIPNPLTPEVNMSAVYLLLLLPLVSTQTFHWGSCPDPQVQPNFALTQYLGRWYEIERLPASFETGKCIEANYTLNEDATIQVLNSQLIEDVVDVAEGTASVLDEAEPAKLGVRFSFFSPLGPYWVLDTDYTNYSVVYSCTSFLNVFYVDFAWILSRTRSLPAQTVREAKDLMTRQNIELCKMKPTDQTGCPDN